MTLKKRVGSDSEEYSDDEDVEVINSSDEEQLSDVSENAGSEEANEENSSNEGSDDDEENDDDGDTMNRAYDSDEYKSEVSGSEAVGDDDEDGDGYKEDEDDDAAADGDDDEEATDEDNDEMVVENFIEVGKGITAQSKLYGGLLACRLKAQEAVTAMNQLPQIETYDAIISDGLQFDDVLTNAKSLVEKTLNELVNLQDQLLLSRDDTRSISGEKSESEENKETEMNVGVPEKRKMEDYSDFLTKRQKLLNNYRDDTLKAVSTLPVRSSFANFESSALDQIRQILLDKERLIKRTQLIRSVFPIIGKTVVEERDVEKASRKQIYDVEVFDDSDFFNRLVTQHTSLKTANFSDLNAVSKQWAEVKKLRKNTAVVDRRASKGRKTRYTVHRKLVNFMTPVEDVNVYSDRQRDALAQEVFSDLS